MTIKGVLKKYRDIEIELLLAHVLGKSKEFLYMRPEYLLSKLQYTSVLKLVKRRKREEPMAYILGYKDFYGLRFKVNRNVLIPRPETEELVEMVAEQVKGQQSKAKILDLGTGSGCIIISLAKALAPRGTLAARNGSPCYKFFASDISEKALSVAKKNARLHDVKIKFVRSDLFYALPGKFDVIVANLPYVQKKDYVSEIKNLEWEPRLALTDQSNHWRIYKRFFRGVAKILNRKSLIFLEIDPKSKNMIDKWRKRELPNAKIKFIKDLSGLWRFVAISS